jgi:hypothetical protein
METFVKALLWGLGRNTANDVYRGVTRQPGLLVSLFSLVAGLVALVFRLTLLLLLAVAFMVAAYHFAIVTTGGN